MIGHHQVPYYKPKGVKVVNIAFRNPIKTGHLHYYNIISCIIPAFGAFWILFIGLVCSEGNDIEFIVNIWVYHYPELTAPFYIPHLCLA